MVVPDDYPKISGTVCNWFLFWAVFKFNFVDYNHPRNEVRTGFSQHFPAITFLMNALIKWL